MTISELTFTFTIDEINTILQALANAPYAKAAPVVQKIESEAQGQLQQAAAEPSED